MLESVFSKLFVSNSQRHHDHLLETLYPNNGPPVQKIGNYGCELQYLTTEQW